MKFHYPAEYLGNVNLVYQILKSDFKEVLPGARIEHIGSSAIKGAVSKGDLDIYVEVEVEEFEKSIGIIEGLGFQIKPDTLKSKHLCMLVKLKSELDIAVQLVAKGYDDAGFIKFRDLLNKNPDLVKQYNKLKLDSTELSEDEYRQKKAEFIEELLATKK